MRNSEQYYTIVLTQPLCELTVAVIYQAADLLVDAEHGSTEFVPLALVVPAVDHVALALDLVVRVA